MTREYPSLIFMGTPEFALPALEMLKGADAPIRLVVTQPDRRSGRGKKLTPPPVKILAEKMGIPVFQPDRIRDAEAMEYIRSMRAECAAVVAYGQILPQPFLDSFPLGALNVHGSLLPQYRGAAPIQRAMLAGDTLSGISIMLLDAGMDTGAVLAQREIPIMEEDTFGSLGETLARLGAELLCDTILEWRAGVLTPRPQDSSVATYAPPIQKDEMRLMWNTPARRIVDTIRAFDPCPGAFAFFRTMRLKCFKGTLLHWKGEGRPGEVLGHMEKGLVILGGDREALAVGELQLEGQRRMLAGEFLRGHPVDFGFCLD